MKITELRERVQGFHLVHKVESDGEATITYKPGRWYWAKITPKSRVSNANKSLTETSLIIYEVIMRKNEICKDDRQVPIRRLRWECRVLDIYTPWVEMQGADCVFGLALLKDEGEYSD